MQSGAKRKGKYSISEVFEHVDASPKNGQLVDFYGDKMHMRSTNILNFRIHGLSCISCDVRGAFFAKEKHGEGTLHLNLYGFDKQGHEILMTKDHIRPKNRGGTNNLYNLQPMCVKCNNKKSDTWSLLDKIRYVISIVRHCFITTR
jgi:hypothetical protein